MKANTKPLVPDKFFHIYNRGINGESIFKQAGHYEVFLKKYFHHVPTRTFLYVVCLWLTGFCHPKKAEQETKKQSGPIQLKVAAYNVEYSVKGSAQEIGYFLKPYNFDIICFSEAPGGDWTKEVGTIVGLEHVVVGKYSTAGHKDKYKTIAGRAPLTDYEEVLMADTLHTATRATTTIHGKEIAVYSVHFPFGWRDQAHIDETTGKITALVNYLKARQQQETSVVMGDFNFVLSDENNKSQYYEMFKEIGIDASWRDLEIDVTHLGSMVNYKPGDPGDVIDHIMYNTKKAKAIDGQIIEMENPLSDHKPVWAILEVY